ncbi:MAG: hypothetical protein K8I27_14985 [Planctomycetes bacterium]|nr:hypothetical protein [Planctomycetota bacterium]
MIAFLLASTGLYVGIAAGVVVLVVVIAVVVGGKKPSTTDQAAPQPASEPPAAVDAGMLAPGSVTSPPVTTAPAESRPEVTDAPVSVRPPTLEVEALSATGEAPMLGAETGEMRMATDELPRMGTSEMPALGDAPATYRTQAAKDLSAAIESGNCPKCNAPTFVGSEDPQEVGADGIAMFKLTGRCGACGHRAELLDMKTA